MNIEELGKEGWQQARLLLKSKGFNVFQIDWMGIDKNGNYILFEIKKKERFLPPPFEGHGLGIGQVKARLEFQQKTGIRTYLLVFEPDGKIWGQYLDILEQGERHDTKNGIRIYSLKTFIRIREEQ